MSDNQMYIGWTERMPPALAKFTRRYLAILLALIIPAGLLIATSQKQFSTAQFEFGETTRLTGVYKSLPVPHLLVDDHMSQVVVLLVGYGKHGAAGVMNQLAEESKTSLENTRIQLKGTLLYGDGKLLMQVDNNEDPLVRVYSQIKTGDILTRTGEVTVLRGEIVDPKCFFGVMKPGEGKVHKDCAIRCIAGGIPPVLKTITKDGEVDYILLRSQQADINNIVLDHIAEPVEIKGKLSSYHNWQILDVTLLHPVTTKKVRNNMAETYACATGVCVASDDKKRFTSYCTPSKSFP
jgi:hypothetical protein